MSLSKKKESYSLVLNFLYIVFFFLLIYLIISMFTRRKMVCGCCSNCSGDNISCPCYRRRAMMNFPMNEYYTPQIGSDFTSYLNQLRQNQLKFSKDEVRENYTANNLKALDAFRKNKRTLKDFVSKK